MMFNDVILTREDENGKPFQYMKVPLNYGPKEKFLARLQGNPDLDRPIAITLPRMSFQIIGYKYDTSRKLSTIGRQSVVNNSAPNSKSYQYNPVPYNFEFELAIMVKNAEDGTRIVEQILPFFAPEWTATLNINPDMGLKYDVPIILDSITQDDTYEGNFENRRALIWTLRFTMKGYLFGPAKTGKIIKQAIIDLHLPPGNSSISTTNLIAAEINIKPGLTADGQPTSNAQASIDYNLIKSTDNYGFVVDFSENR
jgi:T4-like virus Myoviridae tail sheath stabiliser